MSHELTIAIFAGLGGMIGWGFADFLAKSTIDQIGDVQTLFWGQLLGLLPLTILLLVQSKDFHLKPQDTVVLPLMGIWSGLSYIPTYVAFGKGKVSLLSPIFASYAVIVTLLSALILSEAIPAFRAAAMVLVFAGILLISGDPRELIALLAGRKTTRTVAIRGLPEILTAVCLYAVWLIALDRVLSGRNWVPLLLAIRLCSTFALATFCLRSGRGILLPNIGVWRPLLLIGVFDVAAFAFVSYGFSATSYVSVVAMLSSAFSLPTMVLAKAILKEQSTVYQLSGSLLVVAGIVLIPVL